MSFTHNHLTIAGNLTRDPQLHSTSKSPFATFAIAVNRRYRNNDGATQDEVSFFDCVAWNRTAETVCQYLQKGSPVFIEGRLRQDSWEDKEGHKRSRIQIVCENIQFLQSPKSQIQQAAHAPATTSPQLQTAGSAYDIPENSEEPPF